MKNKQKFIATDKLGRKYLYTYLEDTKSYPYNHLILNEDTQSISTVEQEWFNQRVIMEVE